MKQIFGLLLLTLVISSCSEEDSAPIVLDEGKILNKIHKNNVGKIAFMNDWIAFENFEEKDFLSEIFLTNNSDFAFRMFLNKTLTYHLSQLEPNLSVRDLCEKGNFQLTFFVDEKEIYQYNLQTGAGSCDYKNATTVYGIPLVNKNNPDHWGRFLWMKFMKKGGGQQALTGDGHKFKIVVRPYIEHKEFKVGQIIAQGQVNLVMTEIEVDESMIAIQKIAPTIKWNLSNANYDRALIRQLNRKIAQNYFKDITSIAVIKEDKLLIEQYFNSANRATLHDMRSVGKTLASTVMGVAINEGYIDDENMQLSHFYNLKAFENYSIQKEKVTLKSLLTMSSGFEGSDMNSNSPGNEENMYPTSDWVKFALDLKMDESKKLGKNWDYFTAGAVVLGDLLNSSIPEGLQKYTHNKLFKPLGIVNYQWQFTPTGVPNTAGSFQMGTLDNARWGQLYLNNGVYEGKQVLPKSWVQSSLFKHIAIPNRENEHYGYLFWNKTYKVNDKEIEAYYASGNGGNKILILKDINVVIVITATAYNQPYGHFQVDEIIEQYLLPAIL